MPGEEAEAEKRAAAMEAKQGKNGGREIWGVVREKGKEREGRRRWSLAECP